jgi:hypothetical protein
VVLGLRENMKLKIEIYYDDEHDYVVHITGDGIDAKFAQNLSYKAAVHATDLYVRSLLGGL